LAALHTHPVATFNGVIRQSDLEGGVLQLEADDGTTYELDDTDSGLCARHVGARVRIRGDVQREELSFMMAGPRLRVLDVASVT